MQVKLNGVDVQLKDNISLANFLDKECDNERSFAVAINESFVPRSQYAETLLREGDRVEIVVAMQGG